VRGGVTLAAGDALRQPDETHLVPPISGLPVGAHDCGVNFVVDLNATVQAGNHAYPSGFAAKDCAPATSAGTVHGGSDMLTIKYSGADGSVLWQQRSSPGKATGLAVDSSGNVVVTGSSHNSITTDEYGNDHSDTDYYTAKYAAADGALLWEKRYNGPGNGPDQPTAVVVDGNGNVVVTGISQGDYYTAKYAAADGTLLWDEMSEQERDAFRSPRPAVDR
jgi:hypothetical protein